MPPHKKEVRRVYLYDDCQSNRGNAGDKDDQLLSLGGKRYGIFSSEYNMGAARSSDGVLYASRFCHGGALIYNSK